MRADVAAAMMEAYRSDRARDLRRWFYVARMNRGRILVLLGRRHEQ